MASRRRGRRWDGEYLTGWLTAGHARLAWVFGCHQEECLPVWAAEHAGEAARRAAHGPGVSAPARQSGTRHNPAPWSYPRRPGTRRPPDTRCVRPDTTEHTGGNRSSPGPSPQRQDAPPTSLPARSPGHAWHRDAGHEHRPGNPPHPFPPAAHRRRQAQPPPPNRQDPATRPAQQLPRPPRSPGSPPRNAGSDPGAAPPDVTRPRQLARKPVATPQPSLPGTLSPRQPAQPAPYALLQPAVSNPLMPSRPDAASTPVILEDTPTAPTLQNVCSRAQWMIILADYPSAQNWAAMRASVRPNVNYEAWDETAAGQMLLVESSDSRRQAASRYRPRPNFVASSADSY